MAEASVEQRNRILNLCSEISNLRGKSIKFVMDQLLGTKTLASMGYDGALTEEQAQTAISIAERWLSQAKEWK